MTDLNMYTDDANAVRFVRDHADKVRWVLDAGKGAWRVCQNGVWEIATPEQVLALARVTAHNIPDEAAAIEDMDERARMLRHAANTLSAQRLTAMMNMARSDAQIHAKVEDFDRHPHLLAFENGVVDLRTGELLPHDPSLFLGQRIRHSYDPDAKAPLWEALVSRAVQVADDNGETAEFLQRFFGYAMFGSNVEQVMLIAKGPAHCGKSKVMEIIRDLVAPDFACPSTTSLITRSGRGEHHSAETFALRHKRAVVISEASSAMRLDEDRVKSLTGDTQVTVRGLFQQEETTSVTWTIMLATNEDPTIANWDPAIQRRLIRVPFGPTVPVEERDIELDLKIKTTEAQGVIAWLVAGAVRWHQRKTVDGKSGLKPYPKAVQDYTDSLEAENDHVARFIDEMCIVSADLTTKGSDLLAAFKTFCSTAGVRPQRNKFYERLKHVEGVTADARNTFTGIGLEHQPITLTWN